MEPGHITPPWDPDNAMQIDHGNLHMRYLKEKDVVEIEPSTLEWGESKATISGAFSPCGTQRHADGLGFQAEGR